MTYLNKMTPSALPALVVAVACMATPNLAKAQEAYVGEIKATGVTGFCQRGWAAAEGQLLAISQNDALFSLLGTTFGGDGRTTFGLPDLRSRVPIGMGSGPGLSTNRWGQRGGQEQVTLNLTNLAPHSHTVMANNEDGDQGGPGGKLLAAQHDGDETVYSNAAANKVMADEMISPTGGSQPISVISSTAVVRYCIALFGVYPSRN